MTLTLPAGDVKFAAGDVPLGEPKSFLDGQVRVERLPATSVLRPPAEPKAEDAVQDDYPAFWVRYKTGKHYLAWVAYQKEKDRVLLAERDGPDGDWSAPVEVAGPGDHFRVALAGTHNDTLWVVWASQRDHNWDLYGRPYKDGKLGDEVRLTDDAGAEHLAPHDHRPPRPGLAGLAGFPRRPVRHLRPLRRRRRLARPDPRQHGKANDWNPCVAADYKEDRVWVGWDTYETGDYSVPRSQPVRRPSAEARRRAHAGRRRRGSRPTPAWPATGTAGCGPPGTRPGRMGQGHRLSSTTKAGGTRLYRRRAMRVRCLDRRQVARAGGGPVRRVLPPT